MFERWGCSANTWSVRWIFQTTAFSPASDSPSVRTERRSVCETIVSFNAALRVYQTMAWAVVNRLLRISRVPRNLYFSLFLRVDLKESRNCKNNLLLYLEPLCRKYEYFKNKKRCKQLVWSIVSFIIFIFFHYCVLFNVIVSILSARLFVHQISLEHAWRKKCSANRRFVADMNSTSNLNRMIVRPQSPIVV